MLDDSIERVLVNCYIKCFTKIKSAELAAVIYARDPYVKLKNQITKNMGKLEDDIAAIESGVLLETIESTLCTNVKTNRTNSTLNTRKHSKSHPRIQKLSLSWKMFQW